MFKNMYKRLKLSKAIKVSHRHLILDVYFIK
jgi:hypothetical protein